MLLKISMLNLLTPRILKKLFIVIILFYILIQFYNSSYAEMKKGEIAIGFPDIFGKSLGTVSCKFLIKPNLGIEGRYNLQYTEYIRNIQQSKSSYTDATGRILYIQKRNDNLNIYIKFKFAR